MHAKRSAFAVMALLAALPLASCGSDDSSAIDVAVIGDAQDPFQGGIRLAMAGQLVRAATAEGLVAFDAQGRVVPALADRWIVTDDGQSYIFRLRDGHWANGDPITAESGAKALRSALSLLRGTPLALDLGGIDEIRVMAGRVVEIRLTRPMPYLLQLLAQPELGLYHEKRGAGPMALEKAEGIARLTPIEPSRLGLPTIADWDERTRQVDLHPVAGARALEQFNEGEVDLVLGGRIADFMLTRSVGILRGTIQIDAVIGLFGLQVMNSRGFLADPARREALAMAIDRDAMIAPFGVGGWVSSSRIVAPGLDGDLGTIGERWAGQTIEQRRQVAASRVGTWRGTRLGVWLPDGNGSQIVFDRLAADIATIGITLERVRDAGEADLMQVDDVARYPRAGWFLNRLSCSARRGLCSEEADARVAEADRAASPADHAALLTEAEAELTAANVFIPFGAPIRWALVRGSVDGFAPNQWGWHPLMPLAWLPK